MHLSPFSSSSSLSSSSSWLIPSSYVMSYFIRWSKPRGSRTRRKREAAEELEAALLEGGDLGGGGQRGVPKGFLAVYVGEELRRFVIPASYLCHPVFQALMDKVAEEFGFEQTGGLRIPCEEEDFEEILIALEESVARNKKGKSPKRK